MYPTAIGYAVKDSLAFGGTAEGPNLAARSVALYRLCVPETDQISAGL
jgi:hypothetical protein